MPLLTYVSVLIMKSSDLVMLQGAREIYDKVASALWGFVGISLLLRLIYNQVTLGGLRQLGDILVSLLMYTVLIFSTPQVLVLIMNASGQISNKIAPQEPPQTETNKLMDQSFSSSISMSFNDMVIGVSQFWANAIATFLEAVRFWVLCTLFALAPIIIFMGTILGFDLYRKIFFSVLIVVALWPIFSATLGSFALTIFKSKEEASLISKAMLLFIYSSFQGVLPFFTLQRALQPMSSGTRALGNMAGSMASMSVAPMVDAYSNFNRGGRASGTYSPIEESIENRG